MLKKDLIRLCMLHLLTGQDRYGYEMLEFLHNAFPETQESAIYAVLRGLSKDKLTESYLGDTSAGPARKYYRITSHGKEEYERLLAQWRQLKAAVAELGVE